MDVLLKWEAEKVELETRETEGAEIENENEDGNENENDKKSEIELYTKNITANINTNTKNKTSKTSPNSPSHTNNDPNGKYSVVQTEPGNEEIDLTKEEGLKKDKNNKESMIEIRRKSIPEIILMLEKTLKQIASQSPAPISGNINQLASLSSLGLDSFTLVQFKGVLEKRYTLR